MTGVAMANAAVRHRIRVTGVVQGVGFRPFVHRLAVGLALAGYVGNDTGGVFVEVEGQPADVTRFERRLLDEAPPMARITGLESTEVGTTGESQFRIVESDRGGRSRTFVSPDVAVCDDCIAELFDPADRRYRYPFINCTNCGPRFTITVRLPYDRPNTTMRGFPMCRACAAEYATPTTGVSTPSRWPVRPAGLGSRSATVAGRVSGRVVEGTDAAIAATQAALAAGQVVAVKGLGGYHLVCDATSATAVATLRARKGRADKPFAVMVPDVRTAKIIVDVSGAEEAVLTGPARPIVLMARRAGSLLSDLVAPGNPYVGVLLPYTPLHHLLFRPVPGSAAAAPQVLVMTSGNLADEPICYDDDDARAPLGPPRRCLVGPQPAHPRALRRFRGPGRSR